MIKKICTAVALTLCLCTQVIAQNPLVTHMYTADPTARVHDGRLFVYPSTDMVPPEGKDIPSFCMPGYHVFSLEGGSTWKDHGWVLKENEVPWGTRDTYGMWAPDCIEKDGKYYLYYPARPADDKKIFRRVGVSIANKPEGPFKHTKSYISGVSGIDPGLMKDDDGTYYLYWGGGPNLFGAPLKDDMVTLAQSKVKIEGLPAGYKEGSFVFKHEGLYYFTFAHMFPDEGYTIGYATSENPLGPFQYRGKIMDNIGAGTNHHSIVYFEGKWILFYHFWHLSGFNKMRSMCADYMTFRKDGTINKVKPTLRGIGSPMPGDTIQIDRYSSIDRAKTTFVSGGEPRGWMVCEAPTGSSVTFNSVDFGDGSATKMQIRMASGQRNGRVEVRQNDPKGKLIAKYPINFTGGWDVWETQEVEMETKMTGKVNLCVVFIADKGNTMTANVNWLLIKPE